MDYHTFGLAFSIIWMSIPVFAETNNDNGPVINYFNDIKEKYHQAIEGSDAKSVLIFLISSASFLIFAYGLCEFLYRVIFKSASLPFGPVVLIIYFIFLSGLGYAIRRIIGVPRIAFEIIGIALTLLYIASPSSAEPSAYRGANDVPATDAAALPPESADQSLNIADKSINADFNFRIATISGDVLGTYTIRQVAALSNRDSRTFHIRSMIVNGRPECTLYPVTELSRFDGAPDSSGNKILRFDVLERIDDDEKKFDGTLTLRTGDEIQIGALVNDRKEFVPYELCGRPANLEINTDEGQLTLEIYVI